MVLKPLISLIGRLVACSARISVDTQTDRHTDTRSTVTLAAHARRGLTTAGDLAVIEFESCVRGYHVYMHIWSSVVGQDLTVKREPANVHDVHAVAVYYENEVVVHVPYNLAPTVSAFLRRDVNKTFAEVTGDKVSRGAGYGLEIPALRSKMPCR